MYRGWQGYGLRWEVKGWEWVGGSGVATVLRILACLHFQTLTPSKDTTACTLHLRAMQETDHKLFIMRC